MLIAATSHRCRPPHFARGGFSVQSGDRIGLVGRNGAGKTTLMRTLTAALTPVEGTVLRSGPIGYFSQEAALPELEHPDATALERILMARRDRCLAARDRGGQTPAP